MNKLDRLESVWNVDIGSVLERELPWEKFSGQRIVVTGANGFLGGYLTRCLLWLNKSKLKSDPVKVVALSRNIQHARTRFSSWIDDPNLELLSWDLNQIAIPDLGDVNYIFHAASQASPVFYSKDPVGTLLPNSVGTVALLEAMRASHNPKGFLFISSSEVYGSSPNDMDIKETSFGPSDPATLRACYAESKRMGETACIAWSHQFGIPTFILRPFHTYGPGLLPNDGRVFADFAFNIINNENIVMNSKGDAVRAFCYASDAVAGIFTALLKGESSVPYNVANPEGILSVFELAQMLVELYPEKKLVVTRNLPEAQSSYVPSKINQLVPNVDRLMALGWVPEIDPDKGFKKLIEAYL